MVTVTPVQALVSACATQKMGRPNGFGLIQFGWSVFGDFNASAGYYQTRPAKKGRVIVKMRHYWPDNTPSDKRNAVWSKFALGVQAWKALDAQNKQYYNDLKYPEGQSGFNRFMSLWIRGVIT